MAVLSSAFHVPLGTPLFDLSLPDLDGNQVSLQQLRGTGCLLVLWSANHCPYVRHVERALGALIGEFPSASLATLAISSNDVNQYPDDDVAGLRAQRERAGWTFPYLVDSDQTAARTFHVACTPDFFVFNEEKLLVYRGRLDDSLPGNGKPVTGADLDQAVEAALAGAPATPDQKFSLGCNIKWKTGNEPKYYRG